MESLTEAGYVIAVSDLHIGAGSSRFDRKRIANVFDLAKSRAKHVVLNGDIFELLDEYHKGKKDLNKAIDKAIDQLTAWIEAAPNTQFHFVLGNHENVPGFRERLDQLQQPYKGRFEWHPEAIMIGDMVFTHGDLQERNQTNGTRPPKPRGMDNVYGHTFFASLIEDSPLLNYLKKSRLAAIITAPIIDKQLRDRANKGSRFEAGTFHDKKELFHVLVNGEEKLFTCELLEKVAHVCFGHTHEKFLSVPINGIHYHNTGGVTKGFDNRRRKLGFLAGELGADGKMANLVNYHHYDQKTHVPGYMPSNEWQDYVMAHATAFEDKKTSQR